MDHRLYKRSLLVQGGEIGFGLQDVDSNLEASELGNLGTDPRPTCNVVDCLGSLVYVVAKPSL